MLQAIMAPNMVTHIQQDGDPVHKSADVSEDLARMLHDRSVQNEIVLPAQPFNLPDSNINDLGLFWVVQAAHFRTNHKSSRY